ncbi:ribulose-phosphate 3-epimerase [bacterium]|nr:ribulose-phosphate 3-epimerase [bacterium]
MERKIIFATSILSSDFSKLKEEIKKCEDAGADRIHLDVMDGHFVPNLTFGPVVVESIKKVTSLPLDVHLMIEKPSKYINDFINAGASLIAFHVEEYPGKNSPVPKDGVYPRTTVDMDEDKLRETIRMIKTKGVKVSLALNPPTPFFAENLADELNEVLVMTVNPGFGGQALITSAIDKIRNIRSIFSKDIKVDGGVNEDTISKTTDAGANVLVVGSYFFRSKNPKEALQKLKNLI